MIGSNTNQILSKYLQMNFRHDQAEHGNFLKVQKLAQYWLKTSQLNQVK